MLKLKVLCSNAIDSTHETLFVVVDVLRASTTIATAIGQGATSVMPVKTIKKARELASKLRKSGKKVILAGERYGEKIANFNMSNSPSEFSKLDLKGKTVVLTTTTGTKVLSVLKSAPVIFIGSFINARHVAKSALEYAKQNRLNICIVAVGDYNKGKKYLDFSIDYTVSLYIASFIRDKCLIDDDLSMAIDEEIISRDFDEILEDFNCSKPAQNLRKLGLDADVKFSLRLNKLKTVPFIVRDQMIITKY